MYSFNCDARCNENEIRQEFKDRCKIRLQVAHLLLSLSSGHFFLVPFFFCLTLDRLSKRGTTHSLIQDESIEHFFFDFQNVLVVSTVELGREDITT